MRTVFILISGISLWLPSNAQQTTYKFRIRYTDYSPLSNTEFILSGQSKNTDPQGIINIALNENITFLNIESSNLNAYEIKYPLDGKVSLPKDPAILIDVFVAKSGPNQIKGLEKRMDRSNAKLQKNISSKIEEETRKGYNKIVNLLNANNLNDETLSKGRLDFFPLISAALANYLNEARNFNDALLTLSTMLYSKPAYDQFADAIYSYNEAFNLLNNNKNTYEQAISTYWNSKELSLKFNNLTDYAIEDLHKPYILDVNYSLINRIYQAYSENNKKRKKELQEALTNDMNNLSQNLSRKINGLGERITAMNTLLNNNGTVKNN